MTLAAADMGSMWELVERRAQDTPDKPMLVDESDHSITFGQFRDRCLAVAAGLHGLGVRAGTPVSWQLPSRIETVVLSMALARLEAVQNPIIHIYRQREVAFALQQTGAAHVFVPGEWRGFDFGAMVGAIVADMADPPAVHVGLDGLPEDDPATLPRRPRRTPSTTCAGSTTPRARPPSPKGYATATARCSREGTGWPGPSSCQRTTSAPSPSPSPTSPGPTIW